MTLCRVCEYVGTLEHTHFSDGTSQPPLTISQPQKAPRGGLLGDLESEGSAQEQSLEQESSLSAAPVIQPLSIQELVREGSRGRASDFRGGSLMTGSSAAKVVLTLSTQADRCVPFPTHPGRSGEWKAPLLPFPCSPPPPPAPLPLPFPFSPPAPQSTLPLLTTLHPSLLLQNHSQDNLIC